MGPPTLAIRMGLRTLGSSLAMAMVIFTVLLRLENFFQDILFWVWSLKSMIHMDKQLQLLVHMQSTNMQLKAKILHMSKLPFRDLLQQVQ